MSWSADAEARFRTSMKRSEYLFWWSAFAAGSSAIVLSWFLSGRKPQSPWWIWIPPVSILGVAVAAYFALRVRKAAGIAAVSALVAAGIAVAIAGIVAGARIEDPGCLLWCGVLIAGHIGVLAATASWWMLWTTRHLASGLETREPSEPPSGS